MDNDGDIMSESIESLKEELQSISERIYLVKEQLRAAKDSVEIKKLQRELKQLQYQALFYIGKIENLQEAPVQDIASSGRTTERGEIMGNYGLAAVLAVGLINSGRASSPIEAWKSATSEIFGQGTSGQAKGCPKNTFLGLCEDGLVKGVAPDRYNTRISKNKEYAVQAVKLLRDNPDLASSKVALWTMVADAGRVHNSQMDVVISLWNRGLLIKE